MVLASNGTTYTPRGATVSEIRDLSSGKNRTRNTLVFFPSFPDSRCVEVTYVWTRRSRSHSWQLNAEHDSLDDLYERSWRNDPLNVTTMSHVNLGFFREKYQRTCGIDSFFFFFFNFDYFERKHWNFRKFDWKGKFLTFLLI